MDISNLTSLINALRAETQEDSITPESLGALLQRIVDVLGDAASDFTVQQLVQWQRIEVAEGTPYFISLEAVKGRLFVRGSVNEFLMAGLVPYIFRYSLKQHRVRPKKTYPRRKGPRRIGWHMFYGEGKIKVAQDGAVAVRSDHKDSTKGKYWDGPDFLFAEPVFIESDGNIFTNTSLAYGKKTYNVRYAARKFRFGIAFGLPIPEKSNFNFHLLRTNIAVIKVRAFYDSDTGDIVFNWSR